MTDPKKHEKYMVSKKVRWVKSFLASAISTVLACSTTVSAAAEPEQEQSTTKSSISSSSPDGIERTTNENHQAYQFPEFKTCPTGSIQPERYQPGITDPNEPIRVYSNQAYREGTKAYLTGDVKVTQARQTLTADTLTADNITKSYRAEGDLLFTNDNFVVGADSLDYYSLQGSTEIQNTQFHLYSNNGNGRAKEIRVDNKQLLTLTDTDFSTCPQDQRSWVFESEEIIIDRQSGWGKAYNSVVKIADIPVFYLPYITFPVDDRRKTGLLPPSFSNSNRNGRDISIPYYLNLAPNYDLTLTPRYMTSRGSMLGTEFRYLTESNAGELFFEYLPNDKAASADSPENLPEKRWQYNVNHLTQLSENWTSGIVARKVSDDSFYQDFGGSIQDSNQDILSQNLYVQYLTKGWFMRTEYKDWQLLNSPVERYTIEPKIQLTRFFEPNDNEFEAKISSELTRFTKDNADSAERYHIEPSIGWSHETLYSFFRPELSFAYTHYKQTDVTNNLETVDRSLPTLSIDTGLFFERSLNFNDEELTQTLEPRVFYLYTPYQDQSEIGIFDTSLPTFNFTQLFSRNRFSGIDRIGDANQISGALTSRILDDEGREKASVSIGRTVYLKDRKVTLLNMPVETNKQSGLLAEVNWRWTENIEVKSAIEWDDQESETTHGLVNMHYEPKTNHIINLGHRYRKTLTRTQEEAELAFAWPLAQDWRLLGRYNQDLTENRTNDSFLGLEYESCCWAVRVVGRRYINIQLDSQGALLPNQPDEHSSGVYVQFVLKGIGSLQGSTTQFLEDSIYGYEDLLGK
ncbi:LPS-assembly protein LptD [Kangiella sediminilitoris]|uniref:LPS-assembly protein LptD n=1 Tax=Kangiella sediminilitoris TaxID=1144748 RepID=A0A1B3B8I6_9GAMM|nr:LPS assembly protein LptD [Kangiella sediminilitoris]AOE49118.1 LPS-assembly protein LptD [Kangiella sediminilitoris]